MIYGLSLRLFKVPDVPALYIVVTDGLEDGDSRVECVDGCPLGCDGNPLGGLQLLGNAITKPL